MAMGLSIGFQNSRAEIGLRGGHCIYERSLDSNVHMAIRR